MPRCGKLSSKFRFSFIASRFSLAVSLSASPPAACVLPESGWISVWRIPNELFHLRVIRVHTDNSPLWFRRTCRLQPRMWIRQAWIEMKHRSDFRTCKSPVIHIPELPRSIAILILSRKTRMRCSGDMEGINFIFGLVWGIDNGKVCSDGWWN